MKAHAGWSQNSNMNLRYEHWFGSESSSALLEAYGVLTPKDTNPYIDTFKPKVCPQCSENNIHDSKFCSKCKMVLSYDAYNEIEEERKQRDQKLEQLEQKQREMFDMMMEFAKQRVASDNSPEAQERRKYWAQRAEYVKTYAQKGPEEEKDITQTDTA